MNSKTLQNLLLIVSVSALVVAAGWYHASDALYGVRTRIIGGTLEPIAILLKENQLILEEMQSEPFSEKDSGILESYLVKIRRRRSCQTRGHEAAARHTC